MSKYVDRVEQYKHKVLELALIKLKDEYAYAEEFFRDTGYDRYFNKMQKCEKEIQEIEEYLIPATVILDVSTEQYKEFFMLKKTMQSVKSNLAFLLANLPDCNETLRLRDCMREIEDYQLN